MVLSDLSVCFVFERASRAPMYLLLGKGHPMRKLPIYWSISRAGGMEAIAFAATMKYQACVVSWRHCCVIHKDKETKKSKKFKLGRNGPLLPLLVHSGLLGYLLNGANHAKNVVPWYDDSRSFSVMGLF